MNSQLWEFEKNLSHLGWSLWTELGVNGTVRYHDKCLIDLESLIIFTTAVGDIDPRLLNEALDWCVKNHHFVSISRLKTLIDRFDESYKVPFSYFSETLNILANTRWPVPVKVSPGNIKLSKKSHVPSLLLPALFNLRMRSLFGVGARADLITFLLMKNNQSVSASDAEEIGYNKRGLSEILEDFVNSGICSSTYVRNMKKYEISKRHEILNLIGSLPTYDPEWFEIFSFLLSFRDILKVSNVNSNMETFIKFKNFISKNERALSFMKITAPEYSAISEDYINSTLNWFNSMSNAVAHGIVNNEVKVSSHFELIFFNFIQYKYNLDDDLDGLHFLIYESRHKPRRFSKIYKEFYKLYNNYLLSLKKSINDLLSFPIYKLNDFNLSQIMFDFTPEANMLIKKIEKFPKFTNEISQLSVARYMADYDAELDVIRSFIYKINEQLKALYFTRMGAHLLTQPDRLFKRHEVMELVGDDE